MSAEQDGGVGVGDARQKSAEGAVGGQRPQKNVRVHNSEIPTGSGSRAPGIADPTGTDELSRAGADTGQHAHTGTAAASANGRGFFASALGDEAAVGPLFDFDPRHPACLSVVAVVVIALSAWFGRKKARNRRASRRADAAAAAAAAAGGDLSAAGGDLSDNSSPVRGARYGTRTRGGSGAAARAGSPRTRSGKVMILTPDQASLCEVLYDVYAGVVPVRGINSRAIQECGLTLAEIRRQFKNIKQTREGSTSPTAPRSPSTPGRALPATTRVPRASDASGGEASAKQRSSSSKIPRGQAAATSLKRMPVSPRKSPVKRGAATRPTSSPKSGGSIPKRAAAMAAVGQQDSSKPGKRAPTAPKSPMTTRGKDRRAPPDPRGSPKSSPGKRAATGSGKAPSSPKSTPSKRGSSSLLERARREAQLKTGAVANARASRLTSDGGAGKKIIATRSKRAKP